MTRQNHIHKYIRKCQQYRKMELRKNGNKPFSHHTRKWWKQWHKTWEAIHLKKHKNK